MRLGSLMVGLAVLLQGSSTRTPGLALDTGQPASARRWGFRAKPLLVLSSAFLVLAPDDSRALSLFSDDFSDGNDDGWTRVETIASGLPAIYDASSGRYQMSSTGIVLESESGIFARWEDSLTNPAFGSGTLSASVRVGSESTSAFLSLRANGMGSAYVFALNNAVDSIVIAGVGPAFCGAIGCSQLLGFSALPIAQDTDYTLRATAQGSTLTFTAWDTAGPAPQEAQVTVTDIVFSEGAFVIGIYKYGTPNTDPISASFDNVSFVPEPTTGLLLGLGLLGGAVRRRV